MEHFLLLVPTLNKTHLLMILSSLKKISKHFTEQLGGQSSDWGDVCDRKDRVLQLQDRYTSLCSWKGHLKAIFPGNTKIRNYENSCGSREKTSTKLRKLHKSEIHSLTQVSTFAQLGGYMFSFC